MIKILLKLLRKSDHALTTNFFIFLKKVNYKANHIIDIGAHKGAWTKSAFNYYPNAFYTLFEPQKDLLKKQFNSDKYKKIKKFYAGVGKSTKVKKFFENERRDSCSFVFKDNKTSLTKNNSYLVPVYSLDYLVFKKKVVPQPDILKIDAEGWDLDVITGALRTIKSTEVVLLEAGVTNPFFSNTIRAVCNRLYSLKFKLIDITDLNRLNSLPILWNIEMAFIKKNGFIDKKLLQILK